MKLFFSLGAALVAASGACAGVVDTRVDADPLGSNFVKDGVISPNEYGPGNSYGYGGGGGGFGGTVGNGHLYIDQGQDTDGRDNVYFGFQPGNNLNDNVVLFLDTRAGGFDDAVMDDNADPGRNLSSNLVRDSLDVFNAGFSPDFSIVIGQFGVVVFELNAGNTPGHLIFRIFDGTFAGNAAGLAREFGISKDLLGRPERFNFLVGYGSDTNFMSDEAIPAQPFSGTGNLGFDAGGRPTVLWDNYNQFGKIPTPGAAALLGLGGLFAGRRRR